MRTSRKVCESSTFEYLEEWHRASKNTLRVHTQKWRVWSTTPSSYVPVCDISLSNITANPTFVTHWFINININEISYLWFSHIPRNHTIQRHTYPRIICEDRVFVRSWLTVTTIECTTSDNLREGLTIRREVLRQGRCSMFCEVWSRWRKNVSRWHISRARARAPTYKHTQALIASDVCDGDGDGSWLKQIKVIYCTHKIQSLFPPIIIRHWVRLAVSI